MLHFATMCILEHYFNISHNIWERAKQYKAFLTVQSIFAQSSTTPAVLMRPATGKPVPPYGLINLWYCVAELEIRNPFQRDPCSLGIKPVHIHTPYAIDPLLVKLAREHLRLYVKY